MAKLRHIALSVQDLATARKFFEEAFDMKAVGHGGEHVAHMSDGTMSVTLLALKGKPLGWTKDEPFYGIDHFGMWVDDLAEARRKVEAAGATYVMGEAVEAPGAFYEIKYRDPLGNIFDLTTNGWVGAVKDVVPAEPVPAKAAE
jgi:methylmalonyl-CoA/ethylmalonyl-CoA epimerase